MPLLKTLDPLKWVGKKAQQPLFFQFSQRLFLLGFLSLWLTNARAAIDFSREILPLLSDRCFACHGPDEKARKAGLRLDQPEGALGKGKSGEVAVIPKQAARSELFRRLISTDPDEVMPPPKSNHPLSAQQVALIRQWIEEGAIWGKHWAYVLPQRPRVPPVTSQGSSEGRNPIDAFIQARLAQEGLSPSPEATRATLVRRVTLDLTGLPPTPSEVASFLEDPAAHAFERLVDRLLASRRYGERMAWDWLEAARYADSNGYQGDSDRTMWPWRDWVVEAFNENMPFDQVTVWQIAGDRLPAATQNQRIATGFLRNHMINGEGGRIAEENRIDYLFDQTETVATVWLGATFNCTRCHDHKFDPHTQRDYFRLLAFFDQTIVDGGGGNPQSPPNLLVPSLDQAEKLKRLTSELELASEVTAHFEGAKFVRAKGKSADESPSTQDLPKEIREPLKAFPRDRSVAGIEKLMAHWKESDPGYFKVLDSLRDRRRGRDSLEQSIPKVMVMDDMKTPRTTRMLERGSYLKLGPAVSVGLPSAIASGVPLTQSNRLDLARWLVSPENPLTARVSVNRLWQGLFGVGLVKTSEDFGVQGEKPSHPDLLDWLAVDFVASGWDVKRLMRLMVTSATYRQSSRIAATLLERDPENRLLARGPRYRMPSWMIRDVTLAAAGLLTERVGGVAVRTYQPSGVWEEATFGNKRYEQDHGDSLYRRSLYIFWRRILGPTLFFDVASRQSCTVRTPRTNVPLHALLTLNDTGFVEASRVLAEHALEGVDLAEATRVDRVFKAVLGRNASSEERSVLLRGLAGHRVRFAATLKAADALLGVGERAVMAEVNPVELAAWTVVCSTVLNLDEALSKE